MGHRYLVGVIAAMAFGGSLASSACYAATEPDGCAQLLPQMQSLHIAHIALARFSEGKPTTLYCASDGTPVGPKTIFEAASLGKPVFAAAVLELVRQGKLDLDLPLTRYLSEPYRHLQNPFGSSQSETVTDPRLRQVTARMVLSHTSGLPNWARDKPLAFIHDPGTNWDYSGEGYVFLQRAVEKITGLPLNAFVAQEVFHPLGMTRSSYVWNEAFAATALPGHAKSGTALPPDRPTRALAPSTLRTTLDDYSKFIAAWLSNDKSLPFALEQSRQVTVDGHISLDWGLGVAIEDTSPPDYFHWGANPGYQSFFMLQPSSGDALLFFTDSDNGLDLIDDLVRITIPGPHPALKFRMLHPND